MTLDNGGRKVTRVPRVQYGDMLLTVSEVAQILRRTESYVYKLNKTYEIPFKVLGKRRVYRYSDVQKFVEAHDVRVLHDKKVQPQSIDSLPPLLPPIALLEEMLRRLKAEAALARNEEDEDQLEG